MDDPTDAAVIFAPIDEPAGAVLVREITNPYPDPAPDSATLVVTSVTLPEHTCILGSRFYPSMIMTVTSGDISIYVEHLPGVGDAPKALLTPLGNEMPVSIPIDTATTVAQWGWVTIENESLVGFRNDTGTPATFFVAGIKMAGDPGGGGGHRGRP